MKEYTMTAKIDLTLVLQDKDETELGWREFWDAMVKSLPAVIDGSGTNLNLTATAREIKLFARDMEEAHENQT